MTALTLVYVLATIAIVWITHRSNSISRESLRQSLEVERQRLRPFVVFNIEVRQGLVYATARNIGLTPAFDLRIAVDPPLMRRVGGRDRESGLTKHPISFLPPQFAYDDFLDSGPDFFKHFPEMTFDVKLEYRDSSSVIHREQVVIDLHIHSDLLYANTKDVGDELSKLTKTIAQLAQARR